ncbi:MAG TPA: ABC transporter permease [Acidimicrobiia bacterium]|nr:ABC transporter permease [Acidimicrobiia bacterium]
MRATLLIAAKDLRLRIRDRSALMTGVVVPFVLALVFSLILGDADQGPLDLRFGVVDEDRSEVTAGFAAALDELARQGIMTIESLSDAGAGRSMLESGGVGAVFVLPAGFGEAVENGAATEIRVLADADRPTSAAIARSIAGTFATNIEGVRLAALTAAQVGADVQEVVARVQSESAPVELTGVEAANRQLDLTTFFVAGMAVFFLFFTVQFGVTSLLEERREGTMARLLAAPIPRSAIVAAKALVSMALGVVSMFVLIVASTLMLGAEWGNPIGVALLVLAGVVSAVGVMAIVAAFARTPEGAGNLQAVLAVGLGMLGGIFFPTPLGDGLLSNLALLTPHRWFMTGLGDLAGGGGFEVVLPSVAALLGFGLVTAAIAGIRLRKATMA